MATYYDVMALKTPTNQSQSPVNAPVIIDCWLEEGNLTVGTAKTISLGGVMLDRPTYTWASQISYNDNPTAPDWVSLATSDAEYTYAKLQGRPIISAKETNTNPIIGVLGSDPLGPEVIPSSSKTSVATRVAGLHLRHAQVTLFGFAYYPVPVEATTDIAVGDHLEYDNSAHLFQKEDSTTLSPVIACHAATEATGQVVGALFYGMPLVQS